MPYAASNTGCAETARMLAVVGLAVQAGPTLVGGGRVA